jgi:hypothetical protein
VKSETSNVIFEGGYAKLESQKVGCVEIGD